MSRSPVTSGGAGMEFAETLKSRAGNGAYATIEKICSVQIFFVMYKKILIGSIGIVALGAVFFTFRNTTHIQETTSPLLGNASTTEETIPASPVSHTETTESRASEVKTTEPLTAYVIPVLTGGSVLDAMRALMETNALTFSGEEFPGLGYFVNEIGGLKNADGYYWTLFIDGKPSELGASSARPGPGARVEWRYQKGL